jgi:two-component system, sensor histidine kinase LadS
VLPLGCPPITVLITLLRRALPFAGALVLLVATAAAGQDLIVDRAYVDDPTGTMSLEDVQRQPLVPYKGILNAGYTSSAHWIRLTIAGVARGDAAAGVQGAPGAGFAVLRIRPVFIDDVQLFDALGTPDTPRRTGDRHAWRASEYQGLSHGFVIPVAAVPRHVWLRLQTTSAHTLQVEALPWSDAHAADAMLAMRHGLLLMVVTLIAIIAAGVALVTRTRTDVAFAWMQVGNVPYALHLLGYARLLLHDIADPATLDTVFALSMFAGVHAANWFYLWLVAEYRPAPLALLSLQVPLLLLPVQVLLVAAGRMDLALGLNAAGIVAIPVLTVVAASTCRAWDEDDVVRWLPRWLFLSGLALVLLAAAVWFSSIAGWIPGTAGVLYGFLWHAIAAGTVMCTLVVLRASRSTQRRAAAMLRAQIAESEALAAARLREEQRALCAMLTHEVKTGLSVVRMAVEAPTPSADMQRLANQAIDNITQVIDRTEDVERVTDASHMPVGPASLRAVLERARHEATVPDRVDMSLEEGVDEVLTEPDALRRLVALLLENAFAHGASGGRVEVRAEPDRRRDAGVLVWVANLPGASGWPDPDRVFTKYYRSASARHHTGSGLGLSLAASLARQVGSDLRYAPTDTHVRFVLWLPR